MEVNIESSWKNILKNEFKKEYFLSLTQFIKAEKTAGKKIFPAGKNIFKAFEKTPFQNVKVVLLGQDPYHGEGQAHGLSFSVPDGTRLPPSLQNIFKELKNDLGISVPAGKSDLSKWAEQGVLLLNSSLTVRQAEAGSHAIYGWSEFTDTVISELSKNSENIVFILWGKFARQKQHLIDETKHLVLNAAHPSPLSAHAGFFGCKHFSKTNEYLIKNNKTPIDWLL